MYGGTPGGGAGPIVGAVTGGGVLASTGFSGGLIAIIAVVMIVGGLLLIRGRIHKASARKP